MRLSKPATVKFLDPSLDQPGQNQRGGCLGLK
ncbi:hypothetical protein CYB_0902 [Synechococcus sp. JA-2-3B'a(2-13)]|nr:hypothetical protein CYB_0902 [Synechococcus sp. JA-2-3B'a(2-13)]